MNFISSVNTVTSAVSNASSRKVESVQADSGANNGQSRSAQSISEFKDGVDENTVAKKPENNGRNNNEADKTEADQKRETNQTGSGVAGINPAVIENADEKTDAPQKQNTLQLDKSQQLLKVYNQPNDTASRTGSMLDIVV